MNDILFKISEILWSTPLVLLILITGLYFSIKTGFPQLRLIKKTVTIMKEKGKREKGLSPLQSFIFTAARTVGVGNIAGMATGIYYGGPGTIFWLWVLAFFGSAIALVEGVLSQAYKDEVNGEFRGGPANYLERGMKNKKLGRAFALVYATVTAIAVPFLMSGVQSYNIVSGLNNSLGINKLLAGAVFSILIGVVIFGGLKRMANVVQKISPIMALIYLVMSIVVIILNIDKLIPTFVLIFKSALGIDSVFGAIFSASFIWGIRRGVFANEVGLGTSAITSATSEVSHPVKQGLLGGFSVFIGSLFVCTTTTIMILMTNSFNVIGKDGNLIYEGLPGIEFGNAYISNAIESSIPLAGAGAIFVSLAILVFAFGALLAFYLYAETNLIYLFGGNKKAIFLLKIGFVGSIFYGTLVTAETIWAMGDIGNALMAWVNTLGLLFVGNKAINIYNDYEDQLKRGLSPEFNPSKFDIDSSVWKIQKK